MAPVKRLCLEMDSTVQVRRQAVFHSWVLMNSTVGFPTPLTEKYKFFEWEEIFNCMDLFNTFEVIHLQTEKVEQLFTLL